MLRRALRTSNSETRHQYRTLNISNIKNSSLIEVDLAYHDIHLIHTTLANGGGDELAHLAIAQVHVGVKRRRQLNLVQIQKSHLLLYLATRGLELLELSVEF